MARRPTNIITFTGPIAFYAFKSQGQSIGTSVVTAPFQYLIHGPDVTEQFVTNGGISAMGVSYPFNPTSRRTV